MDTFTFKQFTIHQERCAMKVGTDGTLLGAWADVENRKRVLDIGCGSGLIAIMTAQRSDAQITGIEIDADAASQAKENVESTPWSNRIEIINTSLQEYTADTKFDAIVSNPPFFVNSMKCPAGNRSVARHSDTLPCPVFISCAAKLLSEDGTLSVVIPYDLCDTWCYEALLKGLSLQRMTTIQTLPHKPAKRVLLEFGKKNRLTPEKDNLVLEDTPGKYSIKACEMLKDFYLKL